MRRLFTITSLLIVVTASRPVDAQSPTEQAAQSSAVQKSEFDATIQNLNAQLAEINRVSDELKNTTENNAFRMGQLAQKLETLESTLADAIADQKEILDAISQQSSSGQYLPRLAANMSNTEFAAEMQSVVKQSIPKTGTLRITNRSAYDREIWINEKYMLRVPAGDTQQVSVPTGTVTTRLPGQRLVNWTVGAPTHLQAIDIVDRQPAMTTVTYRWPVTVIYP